jgi:hypothetical protein
LQASFENLSFLLNLHAGGRLGYLWRPSHF